MKVAVILSGCGVYDGSEIHESVACLISLSQLGAEVSMFAPDKDQHHVIDHLSGQEMTPARNCLQESARIARGKVSPVADLHVDEFDALVLPGGFGAAKNLTTWAFDGPECSIDSDVSGKVKSFFEAKKPILAMCIAPVVVAKALQGEPITMTLGHAGETSEYDIPSFHQGLQSLGVKTQDCSIDDIVLDKQHNIITTPAYMMEGSLAQIFTGVSKACKALFDL